VDYDQKVNRVGGVFSNVADSYDVMNDAMSLGVHRIWKNTFVDSIGPLRMRKVMNEKGEVVEEVPLKILDVAGGTGDISFRILEKARRDWPMAGSKYI
jgi:2-methoxy-6-polyprenyl-1,4-benzoquinol methylase